MNGPLLSALVLTAVAVAALVGTVLWLVWTEPSDSDPGEHVESYAARRGMEAALVRTEIRRDGAKFRRQLLSEMEELS